MPLYDIVVLLRGRVYKVSFSIFCGEGQIGTTQSAFPFGGMDGAKDMATLILPHRGIEKQMGVVSPSGWVNPLKVSLVAIYRRAGIQFVTADDSTS